MIGGDLGVQQSGAPWWMAGGLAALWIVRETWTAILSRKKERSETDANITLIQGMGERIEKLEQSLGRVAVQLDEEIKLRQAAQEEAHRLRLRVITLESAMRQIGAVIPPEAHS